MVSPASSFFFPLACLAACAIAVINQSARWKSDNKRHTWSSTRRVVLASLSFTLAHTRISNVGEVRYYVYPVHASRAFVTVPTLAASLYLLLLRMMARWVQREDAVCSRSGADGGAWRERGKGRPHRQTPCCCQAVRRRVPHGRLVRQRHRAHARGEAGPRGKTPPLGAFRC